MSGSQEQPSSAGGEKRWTAMVVEYRRLRALHGGCAFGRVEAFGRAIANVEQRRMFDREGPRVS